MNSKTKATTLAIDHFASEKNIQLGLTKRDVVSKLGNCYTTTDSTENILGITYRIEDPQDSRTKLLERQNMPIYYAIYKFRKDKLVRYEFGFEYP